MAAPVRGLATNPPVIEAEMRPSPVPFSLSESYPIHNLRMRYAGGTSDPTIYFQKLDPLHHLKRNKEVNIPGPDQESMTKLFDPKPQDTILKPPRIITADRLAAQEADVTPEEDKLINYILEYEDPGAAYVIIIGPNGEHIILKMPKAYCDCQYECGKVAVYRGDGTLLRETGCCHTNCGCIAKDVCECIEDCALAFIIGSNKQHHNHKYYATLPDSHIRDLQHWLEGRTVTRRMKEQADLELCRKYRQLLPPQLRKDLPWEKIHQALEVQNL
ncbi:hypothetical protein PtA15_14A44 [Puccinia triticina]|uniref:CxC6 like cysteine cluster associated with KDZ domain-containing protein n=1 Tax=Puccinia triticina TaxID=208348 RepID=A0ABY7D2X2_9BASI|nr:uncharacterized protein PtA15_14A44 [Puccinia triticina]WAQ91164.1 hypothetical protein PtA15_14A44 [Puccinia triticina]